MTYYGKRGMEFENLLNYTNNIYNNKGVAVINKRPTPMKIIGETRGKQKICVFDRKSTVDYDGTYKGKSIAFEAKSTKLKRFPLDMLADHQIQYLNQAERHGAISFVLVDMRSTGDVFLLPNNLVRLYVKQAENGARKSIPIDDLEVYGHLVKSQNGVPLDYLSIVDKLEVTV